MEQWDLQALSTFDQLAVKELKDYFCEIDNGAYQTAAPESLLMRKRRVTVSILLELVSQATWRNMGPRCSLPPVRLPIFFTGRRLSTVLAGSLSLAMW